MSKPGRHWLIRNAPWLLAASLVPHVALLVFGLRTDGLIDLRVFRSLPPALLTGQLYDVRLVLHGTSIFPLPFSYPPFAALLFLPMSALPWTVVGVLWDAASLLCLAWFVHRCLSLTGVRDARVTMVWTAGLLWIEPVQTTLDFGQVNLFLAALTLWALTQRNAWATGLGTGIATAVKLVPGISVLYLLATRRRSAAACWAAVCAATAGVAWLISPAASERFWFHLLGDAGRDGPIGSVINQSLRGALSRTAGHDVGTTAPWLIAAALAVVLAVRALRTAIRHDDAFAAIVTVELLGLLLSPISWDHHWVWAAAVIIWSAPRRSAVGRLPCWAWTAATATWPVTLLLRLQPTIWAFSRPWYLSALGWVYPACAVVTFLCIAAAPGEQAADAPREAVMRNPPTLVGDPPDSRALPPPAG
ncbi:glycosyltransferase 87 family protein [Streptomyces sp. RB6PN25]|uniref:Glycosyltransferase 87 family protein n=1 Tax=Streptomyces humicola TaxID=2953240 RepID=A0ABT1PQU3_9ACTN|nr:glycosyltransferase 87 family protein [Streptomyces humicola]MCQ4080042.1 glycosyltransferase 87 family protein [Streptomyces humicola]